MRRIEVYLYRADRDGRVVDNIISGYTGLFPCNWGTEPYSHAAMGMESSVGLIDTFESTSRKDNGSNGTRWARKDVLLRNPERWDMYWMYVTPDRAGEMRARANAETCKPYDWLGIAGFGSIIPINNKQKWYCSEVVWYVLTGKMCRVSPRNLSKRIKKLGFQRGEI